MLSLFATLILSICGAIRILLAFPHKIPNIVLTLIKLVSSPSWNSLPFPSLHHIIQSASPPISQRHQLTATIKPTPNHTDTAHHNTIELARPLSPKDPASTKAKPFRQPTYSY